MGTMPEVTRGGGGGLLKNKNKISTRAIKKLTSTPEMNINKNVKPNYSRRNSKGPTNRLLASRPFFRS